MNATLNRQARTLTTPRSEWSVQAKHTRAGGDADVVLGVRQLGKSSVTYMAFRRSLDEWTQLSGAFATLPVAVREGGTRVKKQVFTATYLVPLLELAATLQDFPAIEAGGVS